VSVQPRRPRLVANALALVAFAGLVTGCANDHPEKLPPTDDPVAWAGRLCSSLSPLTGLRNMRPRIDPNDPDGSKNSLSQYFNETGARIGESLDGLDQVGPSPIPGGDEVAAKVRGALNRLRTAFDASRIKVEGVDTSNPVELGTQLPAILSTLADATNDKDLVAVGQDNEALNDAVRQSPSCAMVKGTPPSEVSGTN
jgi:hypothetical protein